MGIRAGRGGKALRTRRVEHTLLKQTSRGGAVSLDPSGYRCVPPPVSALRRVEGGHGQRWLKGGSKGRVGARREGGENCKGDHAQIQMGGRGARRVGRFRGTNAQTSPTRWCLLSSTTGCNQEPGPACPAGKGQSLSAGAGEPGTRTARACWGRPHS